MIIFLIFRKKKDALREDYFKEFSPFLSFLLSSSLLWEKSKRPFNGGKIGSSNGHNLFIWRGTKKLFLTKMLSSSRHIDWYHFWVKIRKKVFPGKPKFMLPEAPLMEWIFKQPQLFSFKGYNGTVLDIFTQLAETLRLI